MRKSGRWSTDVVSPANNVLFRIAVGVGVSIGFGLQLMSRHRSFNVNVSWVFVVKFNSIVIESVRLVSSIHYDVAEFPIGVDSTHTYTYVRYKNDIKVSPKKKQQEQSTTI